MSRSHSTDYHSRGHGNGKEKKMEENRNPSRMSVMNYCIEHRYFTNGDCGQYQKMFEMLDLGLPLHDIAVVIWICSITDKTAATIEKELRALPERT